MREENIHNKEITIDQLAIMVSNGFNGMAEIFDKKLGYLEQRIDGKLENLEQRLDGKLENLKRELKSDLASKDDLHDVSLKIDLLDKRTEIMSKNMITRFEFDLLENRVKKLEVKA